MKWLAALSLVVAVLLVLIWMQLGQPASAAVPDPRPAAAPQTVVQADESFKEAVAKVQAAKVEEAANDGKIDSSSDEFQTKFDDVIPHATLASAAKCYTGGLNRVHRNQKTKLTYRNRIKDGVVTVYDVKIVDDETTIKDKALNDCFIREVAKTTWTDPELPDWDQPDELIIRPERGMSENG